MTTPAPGADPGFEDDAREGLPLKPAVPVRDVAAAALFLLGCVTVVVGVALYSGPAALIVAGVFAALAGVLLGLDS